MSSDSGETGSGSAGTGSSDEVGSSTFTDSETDDSAEGSADSATDSGHAEPEWCMESRPTQLPWDATPIDVGADVPAFVHGQDDGSDGSPGLALYLPEGDGWADGSQLFLAGAQSRWVEDIDGDGLGDLLGLNENLPVWYRGLGAGAFDTSVRSREGAADYSQWGDMDDDAVPDLVESFSGLIEVHQGAGDGSKGELLDSTYTNGFGPDSDPILGQNTAYVLHHGDFGPMTLIIGRRVQAPDWTWVQASVEYNVGVLGLVDVDSDGDPEILIRRENELVRAWSDGDLVREEVIADDGSRYVLGQHSSGVWWVLSQDGDESIAYLREYLPGTGLGEVLGEFELPNLRLDTARDYGGTELEFVSSVDGLKVLRTFVPCEP